VPDDAFEGAPYYRQRIADPSRTPENFTVRVGETWVATLATKEYGFISFIQGFRADLPPFLRPLFPYRLAWALLMGSTENYLGGLAHEAFHAYQGTVAPDRLAEAESVAGLEGRYRWELAEDAWRAELDALHAAAKAAADADTPEAEVAALARAFLDARETRRAAQGLGEEVADYERRREWLEGLAKVAELTIALAAQEAVEAGTYTPVAAVEDDPEFKGYRTRRRFWSGQLDEVKRMAGRSGETRFYYTGFAQGLILDRLQPGWKAAALDEGVWLEGLVAGAVK
ncbi:MAG: hypothetical protein ACP5HG_14880, partial [Anaerolineae bacterium]